MLTNLILHGHFYQPPRENPWTGSIPIQPSASPENNWNEKIDNQCYSANANSRFLNSNGEILDILNNYKYMSFNFGPTLLDWLKENSTETYKKIIEAHKFSLKNNNGHSNAIAQVYNHIILPLARKEEKETQIIWGIEHYKKTFKHKPEGMWLSETAIDQETIETLIENKIKFVILSPHQAESIKTNNKIKKINSTEEIINEAFWLEGGNGKLAVFFYNEKLAEGISFGHYLRDADELLKKIKNISNTQLIHTATDGEIYGHHEPFGDMCFCALIKKLEKEENIKITNYGNFLELNPPQKTIILKDGENQKGTSWSCFHGVSRWLKDCGCHTGGGENWNQKWRTPLREGLNKLEKNLKKIYIKEIKNLSKYNYKYIRNEYIKVLTKNTSQDIFAKKILKKYSTQNKIKLYKLLEGQKYSMFMFTSCAWFFSDISGIETIQNMCYAEKAIDLYSDFSKEDLREELLKELKLAKSNIKSKKNGKDIYIVEIKKQKLNSKKIASIFLVSNYLNMKTQKFGYFKLLELKESKIKYKNNKTSEVLEFEYTFTHNLKGQLCIKIESKSIKAIEAAQNIKNFNINLIAKNLAKNLKCEDNRFSNYIDLIENFSLPNEIDKKPFFNLIDYFISFRITYLLGKDKISMYDIFEIKKYFNSNLLNKENLNIKFKKEFEKTFSKMVFEIENNIKTETIKKIIELNKIILENQIKIEKRDCQNHILKIKKANKNKQNIKILYSILGVYYNEKE